MAKLTPIDTDCHHEPTPYIGRKHLPCQMFQLNGPYLLTPTAIHVHPVQEEDNRCEALEVSPVLQIQFVFIVFAIYPKLLKFFTLLPIFHRNIPHPFTFKPFHHGPYQDPQAL